MPKSIGIQGESGDTGDVLQDERFAQNDNNLGRCLGRSMSGFGMRHRCRIM